MALRWLEGFELRQHSDYYSRIYASYAGQSGTNVTDGRKVGSAISGTNMQFETRALVPAVENTWIIQFAIRKTNAQSMSGAYGSFILRDASGSGGDKFEIRWVEAASPDSGAFRFELRRGGTTLETSKIFRNSSTPRGWWVVQLKVVVRGGTDGSYQMKVWDWLGNSETLFNVSGVNTAHGSGDGADRVFFAACNGGSGIFNLDDIVIMDGTGSVNNDLTANPLIVMGELPNVDGSTIQWIPSTGSTNFNLVDDGATSPGGTDEVTADTVGRTDLYGFSQTQLDLAPTAFPPAVAGVMVDVEALMKSSGDRTIRVRVKDGANEADDTTDLVFDNTAKISRFAILEENPTGTPAPWTVAVLKTIEIGPKVTA